MGKNYRKSKFLKVKADLRSFEWKQFDQNYDSIVIEQWKMCVESANGITEKRNSVNSIFITVNTALFSVVTFSFDYKSILLSLVGISICILWKSLIDNYKILNEVKHEIINEIENLLPLCPFDAEWKRICKLKYKGLTNIEKVVPIIFMFLYGITILLPCFRYVFRCMTVYNRQIN